MRATQAQLDQMDAVFAAHAAWCEAQNAADRAVWPDAADLQRQADELYDQWVALDGALEVDA